MTTKIQPVLHRILVKPLQFEEFDPVYASAKEAGIELPKVGAMKFARSGVDQGIVVDFGPTVFRDFKIENPLKVGDLISYAKHSGKWVSDPHNNSAEAELLVINDEDVICIFTQEGE